MSKKILEKELLSEDKIEEKDSADDFLIEKDLRTQPLIGFRSWRLDDNELLPVIAKTNRYKWNPGVNKAGCDQENPYDFPKDVPVPHPSPCHCGLNAFFEPDRSYESPENISGAIAGAGEIQIHETGFRAQQAQVLCLFVHSDFDRKKLKQVERVAKEFRIPIFYEKESMIEFTRTKGVIISDYIDYFKIRTNYLKSDWTHMIWKPDSIGNQYFEVGGEKRYYRNNKLHRDDDLPAKIVPSLKGDTTLEWYKDGKCHREDDKPAAIQYNKWGNLIMRAWWKNGKRHRDNDLPAIECADGCKVWCQNGKRHRDNDLPAIEHADGSKEWWQDGRLYRDGCLPAVEYADGSKKWYQNNKFHRNNDLPAVEYADGQKEWYQYGKFHRDGGLPARELANGRKEWWQNGKCHRDKGLPAVEHPDRIREWWHKGKWHRDGDLPAIEHADGSKEWWQHDRLHRDGGLPAIEHADGSKEWYQNGKLHRDGDLPAIEHADGSKEWWVEGRLIRDNKPSFSPMNPIKKHTVISSKKSETTDSRKSRAEEYTNKMGLDLRWLKKSS